MQGLFFCLYKYYYANEQEYLICNPLFLQTLANQSIICYRQSYFCFKSMRKIQLFNSNLASPKKYFDQKPPDLLNQDYLQESSQSFQEEQTRQQKSPFTYLFNNHQGLLSNQKFRSSQKLELISKLITSNSIFKELNIKLERDLLKQICNNIILLWSEAPHIVDIKQNQVYLILEGKTFQYIQNTGQSFKATIDQNNDYIMMRKLVSNEYFIVGGSSTNSLVHFSKYKNQNHSKKYQLMVDEKTLMGKISDQMFLKHFQAKIIQHFKKTMTFLRKIQTLSKLPSVLFLQLSRFMKEVEYKNGERPVQKGEKSKEVFFIKQGKVQIKLYGKNQIQQIQKAGSINYLVSTTSKSPKNIHTQILREQDIFGMDNMSRQQKNVNYEVQCTTDCIFYTIDKRLMAIVISSNEKQLKLKQNNKIISSVNMNDQISGQNYNSKERETLTRNAQRIKTVEKRIRDVKLRSYQNKKGRQFNPVIPQNDRIPQTQTIQQRKYVSKTSDSGFRASNSMSLLRNKSNLSIKSPSRQMESRMYNSSKQGLYKSTLFNTFPQKVSHLVIPISQRDTEKHFTLQSSSSYKQFERINKQSQNSTYSINKKSSIQKSYSSSNIFSTKQYSPKGYNKMINSKDRQKHNGRLQSDIIRTYIDKKLRNQIATKAELVLNKKMQEKRGSIKQIKKFFSVSQKKQIIEIVAKEVNDELLNRLSKMNDCPLLMKIQSQRKRMQSIPKSRSKGMRISSPVKLQIKYEDEIYQDSSNLIKIRSQQAYSNSNPNEQFQRGANQ